MTDTVAAEAGVDVVTGTVTGVVIGVVIGVVLGAAVLFRVAPALKGAPPLQPDETKHINKTAHVGERWERIRSPIDL